MVLPLAPIPADSNELVGAQQSARARRSPPGPRCLPVFERARARADQLINAVLPLAPFLNRRFARPPRSGTLAAVSALALQPAPSPPLSRPKTRVGIFDLASAARIRARAVASRGPHWEKRGEVRRSAVELWCYLQPEPMIEPLAGLIDVSFQNTMNGAGLTVGPRGGALFVAQRAAIGWSTGPFTYTNGNPTSFSDPDGLQMQPGQMTNPPGPFKNNPPPGWGGPRPSGTCPAGGPNASIVPPHLGTCTGIAGVVFIACKVAGFHTEFCKGQASDAFFRCVISNPGRPN